MIRLNNDYCYGAHERVLKAIADINGKAYPGYGLDECCQAASEAIKSACKTPEADIHFLTGGTQTNLTVISSALRPYQSALCASTGHINVHETGAIENCGFKVVGLSSIDGKITAAQVDEAAEEYENSDIPEHITEPKLVYISFPTELGTLYSKKELTEISLACKKHNLYLYIDGARLSYGLAGENNDVSIEDIASLSDVFFIGGTKCGLLFGEAVVITNPQLKPFFRHYVKQKGAMLAKGWLLGIQFYEMFKDGLYFETGKNAVNLALRLKEAFRKKGIQLSADSPTNQQFVIMKDSDLEKLSKNYVYEYNRRIDQSNSEVRFCTSWATKDEEIEKLIKDIKEL